MIEIFEWTGDRDQFYDICRKWDHLTYMHADVVKKFNFAINFSVTFPNFDRFIEHHTKTIWNDDGWIKVVRRYSNPCFTPDIRSITVSTSSQDFYDMITTLIPMVE